MIWQTTTTRKRMMSRQKTITWQKTMATAIFGVSLALVAKAEQICQTAGIAATAPTARYVDHADGTVTDTQTDLMWQTCLVGQQGDRCVGGAPTPFSWAQALLYPGSAAAQQNPAGGHGDWRLPNIRELATLVELQCLHPATNLSVFPNTPPAHLWSSSPYGFYPHYSWYLDLEEGVYTYGERTDRDKYLRLVRDLR